jgi:hypothetical protein
LQALRASAADIDSLVLTTLFDKVNGDLGLKLTDFTDVYNGKQWKEGVWSGSNGKKL